MAVTRVLVPLDGSELAEAALTYLPVLASLGPLRVRLLAVAEQPPHLGLPGPREWQANQVRLLKDYLAKRQDQLQSDDVEVEISVRRGKAAQAIIADATRFEAEFILLSTHGRSGLKRWRLGSVADKVIRSARCNTLVVGSEAVRWPHKRYVRSILAPLDGSELAETALPLATRLAQELGAQLHLVRVVDHFPAEDVAADDLVRMTRAAEEYLRSKAADRWQVMPRTEVVSGRPADSLLLYAGQQAIDLVVMTSHGHGGALRAALGSVTDRLIGGPAPVLIVRRETPEAK